MQVDFPQVSPKWKKGDRSDRSVSSSSTITKPSTKNQKPGPTPDGGRTLFDDSPISGATNSDIDDVDGHVAALNADSLRRHETAAAKQCDAVSTDAKETSEANKTAAADKRADKRADNKADNKAAADKKAADR